MYDYTWEEEPRVKALEGIISKETNKELKILLRTLFGMELRGRVEFH